MVVTGGGEAASPNFKVMQPITHPTIIPERFICLTSKGRVINIAVSSITHISKCGTASLIHTTLKTYLIKETLTTLLRKLPGYFLRIHRSHIMSLHFLESCKNGSVKVNGINLPLSRYFKTKLSDELCCLINKQLLFQQLKYFQPKQDGYKMAAIV